MDMFSIKIAFNFCCLLAPLFAVRNVSSASGGGPNNQQQQQQQQLDVPQPTGQVAIEQTPVNQWDQRQTPNLNDPFFPPGIFNGIPPNADGSYVSGVPELDGEHIWELSKEGDKYHQLPNSRTPNSGDIYMQDAQGNNWKIVNGQMVPHYGPLPPVPGRTLHLHNTRIISSSSSSSSNSSSAVAAEEQHSPAHDQHQKLPQHNQIHDSPSQSENNICPMSDKQEERGLTQKIMEARITAQMEIGNSGDHSQIFLPELLEILENDEKLSKYERTVTAVFIDKEKEWTRGDSMASSLWKGTEWENKRWEVHVPDEQQAKTSKQILKFAIKRDLGVAGQLGADITDLIDILVTTTNAQKDELGLGGKICSRIRDPYINNMTIGTLMWYLCALRRDQSFEEDEEMALQMARKIDDYLLNEDRLTQQNGVEEDMEKIKEICIIFAKTNYSQLRLVFVQKPNGMTIRERLESFSRWKEIMRRPKFLQIIDYLLTDVLEGRPHLLARLLHEKLNKLQVSMWAPSVTDIARILITRAQIDLPDIVEAYNDHKYDMKHGFHGVENGLLNQLRWILAKKVTDLGKRTLKAYIDIVTLALQPGWMDRIDGKGQQH